MAYDPYSEMPSDQNEATFGELAGEVANPINWFLWRYQYDPRVWSMRKGLAMPFGGKTAEYGFGNTFGPQGLFYQSYKSYRTGGQMGRIRAFNRTVKETIGGEFFLGEKFFKDTGAQIAKQKALRKGLRRNIIDNFTKEKLNYHQRRRLSKGLGNALEELLEDAGSITKLNQDVINDRLLQFGRSRFVKDLGLRPVQFRKLAKEAGVTTEGLGKIVRKAGAEGILGKMSTIGFKRTARIFARAGLLAGKGFAMYGAATGLWDLTKMIGEPLGRYLVENTNRLVQAYEDRYMPEMGGRIAMSYMSGGAATERQRAVQAISRSYINGRSAIGHEAEFMHS